MVEKIPKKFFREIISDTKEVALKKVESLLSDPQMDIGKCSASIQELSHVLEVIKKSKKYSKYFYSRNRLSSFLRFMVLPFHLLKLRQMKDRAQQYVSIFTEHKNKYVIAKVLNDIRRKGFFSPTDTKKEVLQQLVEAKSSMVTIGIPSIFVVISPNKEKCEQLELLVYRSYSSYPEVYPISIQIETQKFICLGQLFETIEAIIAAKNGGIPLQQLSEFCEIIPNTSAKYTTSLALPQIEKVLDRVLQEKRVGKTYTWSKSEQGYTLSVRKRDGSIGHIRVDLLKNPGLYTLIHKDENREEKVTRAMLRRKLQMYGYEVKVLLKEQKDR